MNQPADAVAITKASKSNFALAFAFLPKERRRDITTFYAFCRLVDDIADAPGIPRDEKARQLALWSESLHAPAIGEPALAPELRLLIARYGIAPALFEEIIAGVRMDLDPVEYATFEELRGYCHRVASAVGLVSIHFFGATGDACEKFAIDLGLALQLTNIIRDVAQDFANDGRVYIPREDMERFGYRREDLAGAVHDARFLALMEFETERALGFYRSANAVLPAHARRAMLPAEIMEAVYYRLLRKMRRDRFRVFEKRYRLGKLAKIRAVAAVFAGRAFF